MQRGFLIMHLLSTQLIFYANQVPSVVSGGYDIRESR